MTNEQEKAKELAKLLTAFADEKQLQCRVRIEFDSGYVWSDFTGNCKQLLDIIVSQIQVRIKPETKRIALTRQDLIDRINKGKTNNIVFEGNVFTCVCFGNTSVHYKIVVSNSNARYDTLCFWYDKMKDLIFADGTPCYKEVECG